MRNVALIELVMQQIKDHPELHDQGPFFSENECGTAACFGGWACLLSGYNHIDGMVLSPSGFISAPAKVAMNLLGITFPEATTLFSPANSRGMLELMVKDLVNGDKLRAWEDYFSDNLS